MMKADMGGVLALRKEGGCHELCTQIGTVPVPENKAAEWENDTGTQNLRRAPTQKHSLGSYNSVEADFAFGRLETPKVGQIQDESAIQNQSRFLSLLSAS